MYSAIIVRFAGPTNTKGARWIVTSTGYSDPRKVVLPVDHRHGTAADVVRAAKVLAETWGWTGAWHGGWLGDGASAVFVRVPRPEDAPAFVVRDVVDDAISKLNAAAAAAKAECK